MLNYACILVITIIICVYAYFKWTYTYWKQKGVPYLEPSIPFGTSENPLSRSEFIGYQVMKRYNEFKTKGYKHGGLYIFLTPSYLPIDPDYIRNIMSRDFKYFTDRGGYVNEQGDPLSAHLFNLEGDKWAKLRKKLTPTFTSGKMKLMFPTLAECSKQLVDAFEEKFINNEPIDSKEILECFTTDVIGSCAFGIECNSFVNPDNKFRQYGKSVFTSQTKTQTLGALIALANSSFARWLNIALTPKHITDFFINLVRETVNYREQKNVNRKDFMQILIDLKNSEKKEDQLSIEEMAANTFIFFLAGFETSSSTMSFCLFELAKNSQIQEKVRNDVFTCLQRHGDVTYDAVMEMKYLSQVIYETLRKYPPGSITPRVCVEDYKIPGTDVIIDKGTQVLIPILALHQDPEYYPNPDVFDPERFSNGNISKRHPYVYLPFGEGPRICIGLRFGLMQTTVGLVWLLRKFTFSLNERTKIPLEIDPKSQVLSAKDGVWLNVKPI